MTEPEWIDSPLPFLVGDVSSEDFFDNFFEKKALIAKHGDAGRYKHLLSVDRIDEIIAGMDLPGSSLDMARAEPRISRDEFLFPNGMADKGAVVRHFQQGATIIMPHLHQLDATLAEFCRAIESLFCAHVQTNIYLTPPNNQGFRTHYDDHDVFVMQISGQKLWKLYDMPIANPYRGEGFQPNVHKAGDPVEEFLLEAGDCVYIPRGLMHDAITDGDESSLHITVGLIVKTWADLMLEAVSEVALRNEGFRQSLPAGFARDDFDASKAEAHFRKIAEDFSREANFTEAFELFVENFIRGRSATTRGGVTGVVDPVEAGDKFIRRKNAPARLRYNDERAIIICAGGEVNFEREAVPGLETALSGKPFDLSTFADLAENRRADTIKKLIAFGLATKV